MRKLCDGYISSSEMTRRATSIYDVKRWPTCRERRRVQGHRAGCGWFNRIRWTDWSLRVARRKRTWMVLNLKTAEMIDVVWHVLLYFKSVFLNPNYFSLNVIKHVLHAFTLNSVSNVLFWISQTIVNWFSF